MGILRYRRDNHRNEQMRHSRTKHPQCRDFPERIACQGRDRIRIAASGRWRFLCRYCLSETRGLEASIGIDPVRSSGRNRRVFCLGIHRQCSGPTLNRSIAGDNDRLARR